APVADLPVSDRLRRRQHAPAGPQGRGSALLSTAFTSVLHLADLAIHVGLSSGPADDGGDRCAGGGRVFLSGFGLRLTARGATRRAPVRDQPVHYARLDCAVPGNPAARDTVRGLSLLLPTAMDCVRRVSGDGVPDALRGVARMSGSGDGVVPGGPAHAAP